MRRTGKSLLLHGLALAAGVTLLLGASRAVASDLQGTVQSVTRGRLRVAERTVRLDRATVLQDMGGNILGVNELIPGVWVEIDLRRESDTAERVTARVLR